MRRPSSHPREHWLPSPVEPPSTVPFLASSVTNRLHDLLCGVTGALGRGRPGAVERASDAGMGVAGPPAERGPQRPDGMSRSPGAPRERDGAGHDPTIRGEMVGDMRPGRRPQGAGRRHTRPAAEVRDLSGVRILFVDDDEHIRRVVGTMLERLLATATVVSSPLEALRLVREDGDRFDVLVTDLTMPEMSGHQLILRVRELSPSLPVVLISGDIPSTQINACLEQGGGGFLAKPFTMARLADVIHEARDSEPNGA